MAVETADILFPLLTGISVVVVTVLGDRLGGRLGGLLATAPVTTTAAHIVIAQSVAADMAAARVLQGIAALLASTFGIVAFFYAVKYTRGRESLSRLGVGLAVYVAVFLPLTYLFAYSPLPALSGFVLLFLIHVMLAFTFMREPVPVLQGYVPRQAPRTPRELLARFAAGALVVAVIRFLVHLSPPLAGALAVVPAVFLVSITVMGVRQNAPFAARAAQAGLFGTTAVAVFVLVIAGFLTMQPPGGVWLAVPFAWASYALTLLGLGRLHGHIAR